MKELPGKEVELERNMRQTFTALFVVCVGELWCRAQMGGDAQIASEFIQVRQN